MNKTAAMKIAKSHISMYRSGTGWVLVTPYKVTDLDGAVYETHQMNYWMARAERARAVGWLTLKLMGYQDDGDIYWAFDNGHRTMAEMLDGAMDKLNKLEMGEES